MGRRPEPEYLPTPEEIAMQCWLIRKSWTRRVRLQRLREAGRLQHVQLQECHDPHFDQPNPRSHEYDATTAK